MHTNSLAQATKLRNAVVDKKGEGKKKKKVMEEAMWDKNK